MVALDEVHEFVNNTKSRHCTGFLASSGFSKNTTSLHAAGTPTWLSFS